MRVCHAGSQSPSQISHASFVAGIDEDKLCVLATSLRYLPAARVLFAVARVTPSLLCIHFTNFQSPSTMARDKKEAAPSPAPSQSPAAAAAAPVPVAMLKPPGLFRAFRWFFFCGTVRLCHPAAAPISPMQQQQTLYQFNADGEACGTSLHHEQSA